MYNNNNKSISVGGDCGWYSTKDLLENSTPYSLKSPEINWQELLENRTPSELEGDLEIVLNYLRSRLEQVMKDPDLVMNFKDLNSKLEKLRGDLTLTEIEAQKMEEFNIVPRLTELEGSISTLNLRVSELKSEINNLSDLIDKLGNNVCSISSAPWLNNGIIY